MVEIDRVYQHLRSVGFTEKQAWPFCLRLRRWSHSSGLEWTVKRLKTLKEFHLQQMAGLDPVIPAGWAVRQTRHRKTFKDPMVSMVMDLPNTGASLRKKEAFIRLYTVFKLPTVSETQRDRFMKAVTGPYTGTEEALAEARSAIRTGLSDLLRRIDPKQVHQVESTPLRLWAPSEKRAPVIADTPRGGNTPRIVSRCRKKDVKTRNFSTLFSHDKDWQSLWRRFPYAVSQAMVGRGEYIGIQCAGWQHQTDIPAGKIGFIQEGGCKLRSVANPFLAIQALGEPLKRKLEAITEKIPCIGVFNQSSSHDTIIEWLREGKTVSSYDLSSFTDRFPFVLQEYVLELLRDDGYIDQFDIEVVKTTVNKGWLLPGTNDQVKWAVGQPLGFGPSFHLATLTHAALIRGLGESKLFRVVGDDVAIADDSLAHRYSDMIDRLGVEISTSKSIISREYAEFCGKLLSSGGVNPSTKVKLIIGADQLVRLLDFYGPRAIRYLSSKEREWMLKAILPEDLGGLGWSLPGQTYAQRINSLHVDNIAQKRLRDSLEDFLGTEPRWSEMSQWVHDFDVDNRLRCDDVVPLGMSPKGVSGIATTNLFTHGRVEGSSTTYRRETTIDLVDKTAREYALKSKKLPSWFEVLYFDRFGYIDTRQKEPRLPMTIPWSNQNEQSSSERHTRYFRKLASCPEGFSKDTEGSDNQEELHSNGPLRQSS